MNGLLAVLMALVCAWLPAHADTLTFEGNIGSERGVVSIPLVLDRMMESVAIWTDSYQYGVHFDPITALWLDGRLIQLNDDQPNLVPGQTDFDSGLYFGQLAAGSYLMTVTNYANFPRGTELADGFVYDDPAHPALPLNNCPAPATCEGSYYRLQVQNDFATPGIPPVPEPVAWQLLLIGLLLISPLYPAATACPKRP